MGIRMMNMADVLQRIQKVFQVIAMGLVLLVYGSPSLSQAESKNSNKKSSQSSGRISVAKNLLIQMRFTDSMVASAGVMANQIAQGNPKVAARLRAFFIKIYSNRQKKRGF